MGVECPEALPVDGYFQVHSEEYGPSRLAQVRYCEQREGAYRVGLQFVAEPQ